IISFFSFLSGEINLYTHRHYNSDKLLFKAFTKKTGIKINVIKGSADQLIQRLQTEGENSPADILLTVDAGRLVRAKNLGLLQPVTSPLLIKQIPSEMRDLDGYWYGLTVRARALIYSKDRVKQNQLSTYEDLAHKKWRGRIVVRSSNNIYNQSLLASIIAANGELDAYKWAKSVRSNMARSPRGSDRDQARAVASGLADVAIMNTYYLGVMANSSDKKDQDVVKKIAVFFPNQKGRGTHINVSGAGITKSSKNKEKALKFLEFLTNENSQKVFSSANYEYPLKINEHNSTILKSWGQFKYDPLSLSVLGEKNTQAVKIFDRAGWE
ncbi:Fe(3+) ABC transporter substrate-binding protein, partial [Candidatus Marinimicrobia bacterium]|nr:Fe(3+) ABC transporter substrate-binding protein [Candidatus Neomarinimicrobiota bacterium]